MVNRRRFVASYRSLVWSSRIFFLRRSKHLTSISRAPLTKGKAGDSPAPVGDPPTGTTESNLAKGRSPMARTVTPVPSGESPDGTGGSPVLPRTFRVATVVGLWWNSMRQDLLLQIFHDRFRARVNAEFFKNVFDVAVDGPHADFQHVRDFLVLVTLAETNENFAFALR